MAESMALWRCPSCQRLLEQRSPEHVRRRFRAQVEAGVPRPAAAEFVEEALWPAYLASLRRCRCGSRRRLKPVSGAAMRGQLSLRLDAVVLQ